MVLPSASPSPYYVPMCAFCGAAMAREKPGFNEVCGECGQDLHACRNCRFFRKGARWDCAETIEAQVVDKDRRNLCDWYETDPARFIAGTGDRKGRQSADKARSDFDRLFGAS